MFYREVQVDSLRFSEARLRFNREVDIEDPVKLRAVELELHSEVEAE